VLPSAPEPEPTVQAEAAVAVAAGAEALPVLVPPAVSRAKLARDLESWRANARAYRQRGWLLLGHDDLTVDVGFLARVAVGRGSMPIITVAIRLDYTNYDLWPPSLLFIDPHTGAPVMPPVRALDEIGGEVNDALIDGHPDTGLPFLCLPGLREYHSHPQHSGDDWLLHRRNGAGNLHVVCDRVWRRMARNVLGLMMSSESLPGLGVKTEYGLAQGNIELVAAQVAQVQPATPALVEPSPPGGAPTTPAPTTTPAAAA